MAEMYVVKKTDSEIKEYYAGYEAALMVVLYGSQKDYLKRGSIRLFANQLSSSFRRFITISRWKWWNGKEAG
jgi:hypothetical protein